MSKYITEMRKLVGTGPLLQCGSAVILLDHANRVLLHHRTDNDTWGLPGGTMELGKRLEDVPSAISPPIRVVIEDFRRRHQ